MELRGIASVIASEEIRPGLLHWQRDPEGGVWLALRIEMTGNGHQEPREWDLIFDRGDRHGIFLQDAQDIEPVVATPPVNVRIKPSSNYGHRHSTNLQAGTLAVVGQDIFVKAPFNRAGHLFVNLRTGAVVPSGLPSDWVAFSEWALVVDEGEKEIALVDYVGRQAA